MLKCPFTSLYGTLFTFCASKGVDEVGKGAVTTKELLVGATLCNLSIHQYQDEVGLWQEAHPMGHQDAGL